MSFFPASTFHKPARKSIPILVPRCGECGLLKTCRSPKMPVRGQGRRRVLVVGEAPGHDEDRLNRPFVGKSGQHLRAALRRLHIDLDRDCWTTNALRCRPPNNKIKQEGIKIEACRPLLLQSLEELQPDVIVLLGAKAVRSLVGYLWKEDVGGITRWTGWNIPCRKPNAWVCPTFHPSYLIRQNDRFLDKTFARHLEAAFELEGKPWKNPPDYRPKIEVLMNPDEAAARLRKYAQKPAAFAFDYETNMLKPDAPNARIRSCSVCYGGKETIAFPWVKSVFEPMRRLITSSKHMKIASNVKFEMRWTLAKLGVSFRGPFHDTMVTAHGMDNRKGTASIKFQAFVRLGQEDYDSHIKPYLQSKESGGNAENRIREVGMKDLLLYNGLDSLLEYRVAMMQLGELEFDA